MNFHDFKKDFLYKKPKVFKGGVKDLNISWQQINELYQRANPIDELFRLRKGEIVPISDYVESFDDIGRLRHRFVKPVIYHHLKQGATIVYNRINNEPFVDALAKQVSQFVGASTVVSGYLAFGKDQSYKTHWDTRDVFAVQLMGKKRWKLSAPNFVMPLHMQQSKDVDVPEPQKIDMDIILEAGDILYIPRGWWHNPVPMGCETFHLAIGTFAPTGYDYIEWLLKEMPNITALRYNLSDWMDDKANIISAAQEIIDMIGNHENYDRFMQDFLGNHRTDSNFNMQLFGNPSNDRLPEKSVIKLNIVNLSTINDGYVICNGSKIVLDDISKRLLRIISETRCIQLSDILQNFDDEQREKVGSMVYNLAQFDILEVIV
ncbi:MAG: cupin domain-containing protein [Moraxella sp.]|nr:cupin domain-containing protein [Moraxella sp.]